jgi:hypothetical protein
MVISIPCFVLRDFRVAVLNVLFEYHLLCCVQSLDLADDTERDHVLSDLQESQSKINNLIDGFNLQALAIRQSSKVSPSHEESLYLPAADSTSA